jgi:phosphomannomutase
MSKLMRSVSGVRGVIGVTLRPDGVIQYVNAFCRMLKATRIVVGRDSRPTGSLMEHLVFGACEASGVDVIHLGLASTPTVEMMVERENADGGIILTASHNDVQWNALKFINANGLFLGPEQIAELFQKVDAMDTDWVAWNRIGHVSRVMDGDAYHIKKILELSCMDVEKIRKRKFKVAYDAVNGAGSLIIPELLEKLGCEVVTVYTTPDGTFPRGPEPIREHLLELSRLVREHGCDVGFATDPDADRLALVSEDGVAIGEEYTLAMAVDYILSQKPGPVTINLSTSRLNEDVAKRYGCICQRSKVGEINVSLKMMENGSVVGGEGNGGVILPDLHYGRDAVLGVALVLQWMAHNKETISGFVRSLPEYIMRKDKIELPEGPVEPIYQKIMAGHMGYDINTEDGIRLEKNGSWLHLRASNTEPIMRIIGESCDGELLSKWCAAIKEMVQA